MRRPLRARSTGRRQRESKASMRPSETEGVALAGVLAQVAENVKRHDAETLGFRPLRAQGHSLSPAARLPPRPRDVRLVEMAHFPRGHAGAAGMAAILAILWSSQLRAQAPAPAYPRGPYPAAPYQSQPGYPAPASPPLQTGGLTPPPSSTAPQPGEAETYQQLQRAERED